VLHIVRQYMAKRRFPTQDHPRETFLLDRAHPPLRIGVQIGDRGGSGTRFTPAASMMC
jgi:hypothetical protein